MFGDVMIKIESLDHSGRGIAKLNNKVVFVNNALPGEIVEIRIISEKKNYIEAEVVKYIEKSKDRIDSICPYYSECGGCDILHMNYKDQLKFKQEKIENIINKYLNTNIKINPIVKCDNEFNYRNKVTFHVNNKIGFFKNKTNDIVKIENCPLVDKKINDSISYLNKLDLNNIDQITCRIGMDKLMIIISSKKEIDIKPIQDIADSIYINDELVYGEKNIYNTIGEYKYIISPNSFFQINNNTCKKLYDKIKEETKDSKNILDLYCGTGSIGIYISENKNVLGIEINESAIENANTNKVINNLENIDFICGDSGKKSTNLSFNPDTIIVDPPRSGLDSTTIKNLVSMNPNKIIYVSCDPMTLVRDLNELSNYYNINEITPFDMFPQTKHVESLCILTKS